jgi:single-strand DNA-binding protein
MMQSSAYGRIGQDPRSISTKSGNPMAAASLAVSLGDQDAPPLWVGIVAFGRVAEDLLRHSKGDLLSVSGRVQQNTWTDRDGKKHDQLQIVADSLVSSRTVRPSGGGKRQTEPKPKQETLPIGERRELNDEIPF